MTQATLLVELLTEELPPKSLTKLADAFSQAILRELRRRALASSDATAAVFATPRRLGTKIRHVLDAAPDRSSELTGPSTKAPEQAVAGFARKAGVDPARLERRNTPKGEVYVARITEKGAVLREVLASIVTDALKALPIPKVMRWGSGEAQFVRPVHGLVMMHGSRAVPGAVLGIEASAQTRGHRFMGKPAIALANADEYEGRLAAEGMVIADFAARRSEIERQLAKAAAREGGSLGAHTDLLDEVTALVEHPTVYVGRFDQAFLDVPQECLILTMRQNQKYFPLFDASGRLQPKFLIVSNMRVDDARHIVGGNERVVRPRLEDARFFYDQDRKTRLENRVPDLARVVYHNKLGTQLERVERIQLLAGEIARSLGANVEHTERAAWLAKADLYTGMVGEFPELQGIMGRYYALHDGEPREVADAIEAHYRPRFAGDRLPEHPVSRAVALADKLDTLAGLFGIGQTPTGDRDPFGLRRAALGAIRILVEGELELRLFDLVNAAFARFDGRPGFGDARTALETFIFDRARGYFQDAGYSANEIESVLCLNPSRLDLVPKQLEAVRAFSALPEAESLAAANKRIGNILKQADTVPSDFDASLMVLPEEKRLATTFQKMKPDVESAFHKLDYTGALRALASLKEPVDAFFDKVMVMDKDPRVRANRIAFLGTLHGTMNRIADLSKLAK
ncbi:MAG: glycine--tRNA ligase subunit beta [Betaproteobacteria bacterium RIFCSPLOWO2_12_FULL_65_14]|nr:MAG: glycine--tRNA ligase subunit beta [Betaproteobacteria bacterium RIFCSPLOWO2_12_FULL_65_14]